MPIAREMARLPGVAERLLGSHFAAEDGRCAGCATAATPGAAWPCTLHSLATEAMRLGRRPIVRPQSTQRSAPDGHELATDGDNLGEAARGARQGS